MQSIYLFLRFSFLNPPPNQLFSSLYMNMYNKTSIVIGIKDSLTPNTSLKLFIKSLTFQENCVCLNHSLKKKTIAQFQYALEKLFSNVHDVHVCMQSYVEFVLIFVDYSDLATPAVSRCNAIPYLEVLLQFVYEICTKAQKAHLKIRDSKTRFEIRKLKFYI